MLKMLRISISRPCEVLNNQIVFLDDKRVLKLVILWTYAGFAIFLCYVKLIHFICTIKVCDRENKKA